MWSYLAIGILCLAGSAILLGVLKALIETVVFIRSAVKTEGKVVRLATKRNIHGQTLFLPVFEYRTSDGSAYEYTWIVASQPPAYDLGETATILYLRKNPQNAKIRSFSELWLVKTIFAILGFICLGGAAMIFLNVK